MNLINRNINFGIHALRGISSLLVILYHYKHFYMISALDFSFIDRIPKDSLLSWPFKYGTYGVEVFWMISGFILTQKYFNSNESARGFLLRRFARIYPLHLVTLLLTAAIQLYCLNRLGYFLIYQENGLEQFFLQIFLASNWFNENSYSFNAPIWSVSVEILVYIFFGLFFLKGKREIFFFSTFAFITGIRFFLPNSWLFSAMNFYLLGGCIWLAIKSDTKYRLLLFAFIVLFTLIDVYNNSRLPLFIVFVFGILFNSANKSLGKVNFLSNLTRWIGDISFSLYLLHVPIQLVLIAIIQNLKLDQFAISNSSFFVFFYIGICLTAATFTFKFFEMPTRVYLLIKLSPKN